MYIYTNPQVPYPGYYILILSIVFRYMVISLSWGENDPSLRYCSPNKTIVFKRTYVLNIVEVSFFVLIISTRN